ncbi:response regulator [Mesorhizobium sp. M0924]|uniref:response regulator n=1 Tax=unclassified Mesorhizobium TaxID=325217 RepID=UPI00333A9349
MVVDGDVITRIVIADYLRNCGYRVVEARDADEARAALNYDSFSIDVILCDVGLPGEMNGFQLRQWVRDNKPGIKVVLSGAVERAASDAGELCEQGPHLAKPYDPATVVEHIRRLKGGSDRK